MSSADALYAGGNHVAWVVALVAVPNLSSPPLRMGVALALAVRVRVAVVEVVSEVVSGEVDVGLAEDVGGMETEDSETGVAVASEEAEVASEEVGMTLDPQEVVAATGSYSR